MKDNLVIIQVPQPLTDVELLEIGQFAGDLNKQIIAKEIEKKEALKSFTDDIKFLESQLNGQLQKINDKSIMIDKEVIKQADYTLRITVYLDPETKEVIKEEPWFEDEDTLNVFSDKVEEEESENE
jgi:hypothetical protein